MFRATVLNIFVLICLLCSNLSAQEATTFTVRGLLGDSIDRQPLDAANVIISRARDSVYVNGAMSNQSGVFEIDKLASGQYLLVISYLGYETKVKPFSLSGAPRTVNLGNIGLKKQDMMIDEVVVTAKFNPIIVKKDTIEYNTDAYKTQDSDVVEDLLKKLPGVEVESDGTVTAGGQQITKVFVDGKQFFGDDPKVALKNLPANIVDRVQVVDRKSDQAQFTGIEDDDTEKILNLTLRPGNRDGVFGRALVGYGTDKRYDANGLISYFNGDTQLAALFSSNNTNNLNFSDFMGDVISSMGGSGRRQGGGGGGGGPIMMMGGGGSGGGRMGSSGGGQRMMGGGGFGMFSSNVGMTKSSMGGANINYVFNEKLKINGSYNMNLVDRYTDQTSDRINYLSGSDSTLNYKQVQNQDRKTINQRASFELDYTINDNNSLLFRPYMNIGGGETTSDYNYITLSSSNDSINSGKTTSNSKNTSLSTSGMLLWRHQFDKTGRTLSVNFNYGISKNEANGDNYQENTTYDNSGIGSENVVDQKYTNNNNGYNFGARASYVEPVGDNRFLEFSYSYSRNNTKSEKETFDKNATGEYDDKNDEYSTLYENTYINQQADIRFNTRREKYSYTLGAGLQPSKIISVVGTDPATEYPVLNFSPTVNITYGQTRQNMLRFDYRGMTQQPSIQQLQPVADNSDPLYEYKGNQSLKPAFRHNMYLQYNNFNPENFRTFLTSLGFNTTMNSIINASVYDKDGKQTVTPENVNGVYNINAGLMMNLPIAKTKLSFSNTLSGNYGNSVSKTNNVENNTKNTGVSETVRLTFRNNWLEIGTSYMLRFNRAVYSLQDKATTNYYNHRLGGDIFINLPLNFVVTTTANYNFYRGYGDDYNRDMVLWNGDLSKKVFKNKQGTIKLSVYDILKQNRSYTRTTTDNYREDLHSNTLGRFAMISFMYRFNSFSGGAQPQQDRQRDDGMSPRRFDGGGQMRFEGGPPSGGGYIR